MSTDTLKTMTKAELIALLQKRNAEISTLRLDLSIARADAARGVKPLAHKPFARNEAMELAREAAMRTGKCVLVAA